MAKRKKTWFTILKRLFISEPHARVDKKDKRKRWVFRLLKMKDLSAPSPQKERLQWDTSDQTNNNALPEPTQIKQSIHQHEGSHQERWQQQLASRDLAAIKIQAAFRGYLARKALRALKGVVKLQALIRGWAVRQQAINTLKCLQSIVNIQTEVCSKRSETSRDNRLQCQEHKSVHDLREKDIKVDLNSQKRWDDSTLTKDELKSLFATKKEASMKRERIREFYFTHRRSAETERDRAYGRRRYWLEQWVDAQLAKSNSPRNFDRTISANARTRDELASRQPCNFRHLQKQYQPEISDSPSYVPRRTYHHRKQRSIGEECSTSFTSSPAIPAYMAATESARAKARSLSSPRLRPLSFDVCSEIASPYKHKLSPISSINSELTSRAWVGNHMAGLSQRSPRLKSMPGPIKSAISTKELRLRGIYCQNGIDVALADDPTPTWK